jgi:hypothetical protein
MIIIGLLLICFAGISEAIMDKIQFHYNKSLFSNKYFNQNFWNPSESWKNKWKEDFKTEKFLGSSSIFVFLTDAWHLFKFFRNICLFIGLPLITFETNHIILICVVARIVFGFAFTVFFNLILNNNSNTNKTF